MTIHTVYIVEYGYGVPGHPVDRRTTTRYTEDRYIFFMDGLEELFHEGKVTYINAFRILYEAGEGSPPAYLHLVAKKKPSARIQELNPALLV